MLISIAYKGPIAKLLTLLIHFPSLHPSHLLHLPSHTFVVTMLCLISACHSSSLEVLHILTLAHSILSNSISVSNLSQKDESLEK